MPCNRAADSTRVPKHVQDELFRTNEFFDPRDLVQVKYEMLRRAQVEGLPISQAAEGFGFSRPAYYHALEAFQAHGLPGLIRKRPGPKRAHKFPRKSLTTSNNSAPTPSFRWPRWWRRSARSFVSWSIPAASSELWNGDEKKGDEEFLRWRAAGFGEVDDTLRGTPPPDPGRTEGGGWGRALLLRRGLVAWMQAWPSDESTGQEATTPAEPSAAATTLPAGLCGEITRVLVNMILDQGKELAS